MLKLKFIPLVWKQVPRHRTRTLLLQCSDDLIAPIAVGDYLHRHLPESELCVVENIGHCPHLSNPGAIVDAMREFLA